MSGGPEAPPVPAGIDVSALAGIALEVATGAADLVAGTSAALEDAALRIVATHLGLVTEAASCTLLDLRAVIASLGGQDPGAASSVRKLVGVQHRQATLTQQPRHGAFTRADAARQTEPFDFVRASAT